MTDQEEYIEVLKSTIADGNLRPTSHDKPVRHTNLTIDEACDLTGGYYAGVYTKDEIRYCLDNLS